MLESRIGVTGGSGFVGARLTKELKTLGYRVSTFDRSPKTDLVKNIGLDDFLAEVNIVINLVGSFYPPFEEQLKTNVLALSNLCEAAVRNKVRKIIHISASAVYGDSPKPKESDPALPSTTYGLAKKMGEEVLEYYNKNFGVSVVIFRPPNVYGPGSNHGVIYNFFKSIKDNGKITIFGDGKQERDFLYVDDLVKAIIKALNFDSEYEVFNIGTGKTYNLIEVINVMEKVLGRKIPVEFKEAESFTSRIVRSDILKVRKILNWKTETTLLEGLEKTYGE